MEQLTPRELSRLLDATKLTVDRNDRRKMIDAAADVPTVDIRKALSGLPVARVTAMCRALGVNTRHAGTDKLGDTREADKDNLIERLLEERSQQEIWEMVEWDRLDFMLRVIRDEIDAHLLLGRKRPQSSEAIQRAIRFFQGVVSKEARDILDRHEAARRDPVALYNRVYRILTTKTASNESDVVVAAAKEIDVRLSSDQVAQLAALLSQGRGGGPAKVARTIVGIPLLLKGSAMAAKIAQARKKQPSNIPPWLSALIEQSGKKR